MKCTQCAKEFIARVAEAGDETRVAEPLPPVHEIAVAAEPTATIVKKRPRVFRAACWGILMFAGAGVIAGGLYEMQQRLFLEERLATMEGTLARAHQSVRAISRLGDTAGTLTTDFADMDDVLTSVALENKQQGSTLLRSQHLIQHMQKAILRQQSELGRIAARVEALEREVADKSKEAHQALELAAKIRKTADQESKPIRARIRKLEEQKEELFARYQNLSTPRRPQGVVSTRSAAAFMKDWERRAQPMLQQLDMEIEGIRQSIEDEESKIDELYHPF